jgi:hypothetical protein
MIYPGVPKKAKYKYYACSRRVTYKDCKTEYIRADILENSVIEELRAIAEDKPRLHNIINKLKNENAKALPSLKLEKKRIDQEIAEFRKEKTGLLKWMSRKEAKPYTLNALNERFEKLELEINDRTHRLWQVEEDLKKRLHFGLSSEKVSLYLKNIVETFADFDRQEKKRILLEVLQKIKVNSLDEVHLFLSLPRKIFLPLGASTPLGETLQFSALLLRNTQKTVCQLTYSLKDYYGNIAKSI